MSPHMQGGLLEAMKIVVLYTFARSSADERETILELMAEGLESMKSRSRAASEIKEFNDFAEILRTLQDRLVKR